MGVKWLQMHIFEGKYTRKRRTAMELITLFCTNTQSNILVNKGSTLLEIATSLQEQLGFKPISCWVNNNNTALSEHIFRPAKLNFIGFEEESGRRTYFRTLSFIISKAVHDILPSHHFRVEHSLANGYYCSIQNGEPINLEQLQKIRTRVDELIAKDLPFEDNCATQKEAIDLFQALGEWDKVSLIETHNVPYIPYQTLEGYPDCYYGPIAPSTGYVYLYAIDPYLDGLLVRIPDKANPQQLPSINEQPKLRGVLRDQQKLLEVLGIPYIGSLNKAIEKQSINDIILVSEAYQERQIASIAQEIAQRYSQDGVRIVLISGPSSSGKTTFTKRLATQLRTCLIRPHAISIDDYFVPREFTPRDEHGQYDFESIEAVDIALFNEHLQKLLAGEEVEIPSFEFKQGARIFRPENKLHLDSGDLLLIEGIHGLNPALVPNIPEQSIFRIYVSALTAIALDAHNRVSTADNRLLRRMIRDYKYRGRGAVETLSQWTSVRKGEEKWVFPFQENADAVFNSAMVYEIAALRRFVEPMLMEVPVNTPEYSEAQRLLRFLRLIHYIQIDKLPGTSLLREFLGGSFFHY